MSNSPNGMFIERPEVHEAGAAGELYCWMPSNADRECGGSCVAFDTRSVTDKRVGPCMVLNTLRSIGMAVNMQARKSPAVPPPEVRP